MSLLNWGKCGHGNLVFALFFGVLLASWTVSHVEGNFECSPSGFMPHWNCSLYYQCSQGYPVGEPQACPSGLYWDTSIDQCNYPDQVTECVGGTRPSGTTTTPMPSTTRSTTPPTTTTRSTTTSARPTTTTTGTTTTTTTAPPTTTTTAPPTTTTTAPPTTTTTRPPTTTTTLPPTTTTTRPPTTTTLPPTTTTTLPPTTTTTAPPTTIQTPEPPTTSTDPPTSIQTTHESTISTPEATVVVPPPLCRPEGTYFIPKPGSMCKEYIMCAMGTPFTLTCTPPNLYDPRAEMCVFGYECPEVTTTMSTLIRARV